ncbi:caspase family protein [Myxococcota bacterium]|nr:caspase family protein [Myxococcota bacterium]
MSRSTCTLLVVLAGLCSAPAEAITLRYGLVVGNSLGTDPELGPLPPLLHAEREATRLHAKLVECCNFDRSPSRTRLLIRPTRAELVEGVAALRAQMDRDRETYGRTETLFAFFFTGHGLNGRVLLSDGPLGKRDLAGIFEKIGADLTLGVFDACFSGSLDPSSLSAKGVRPTPGVNVFRELPQEILGTKGSIWFVSSGPDEPSYEDRELGGVFTHFVIEALDRAEPQGPGIPLDRIWSYARAKTRAYTTARNKPQNPEKIVAKMTESAAVYFSFPSPRDATLTLGRGVGGTFLLTYAGDHLSERIVKRAGVESELAIYSGPATLTRIVDGRAEAQETLEVARESTVVISSLTDAPPAASTRSAVEPLWVKGLGDDALRADVVIPRRPSLAGVAFDVTRVTRGQLYPEQVVSAFFGHETGDWLLEVRGGYGARRERFEAWGYRAHAAVVDVRAGLAWPLPVARVALLAALEGGPVFQRYDDGARRTAGYVAPKLCADVAAPTLGRVEIRASIEGGVALAPGAGAASRWRLDPIVGASLRLMIPVD